MRQEALGLVQGSGFQQSLGARCKLFRRWFWLHGWEGHTKYLGALNVLKLEVLLFILF